MSDNICDNDKNTPDKGLKEDCCVKENEITVVSQKHELTELLKMFTSIGFVMGLGILLFFSSGWWLNYYLVQKGINTYGVPVIIGTILGIFLSFYWCYLKILHHNKKYAKIKKNL